MAARRCTLCGVNYPNMPLFERCPIHGEPADLVNRDPDPDWKVSMERLARQAEKAAELAAVIPLAREVAVIEDCGLLWVEQEALQCAGVRFSSTTGGFRLFELEDGFIYELQSWDEPRRRWWVERVAPVEEPE